MSEQAWGWVLFGCELVGITGVAIAGRKLWWGWLVVVAGVSVPWMTYSITTQKWGFLALSALWMTVNLSNAVRWKRRA